MKRMQTYAAGVDVIGDRYHVCLLDAQGKHPRIYHGRVDTVHGQNKLVTYLNPEYVVVVAYTDLVSLLVRALGEERVFIKDERQEYTVWERAGIKRGDAMARFAARILYEDLLEPRELTEQERRQVMSAEWERVQADVARVERAQQIIAQIMGGNGSGKLYAEATRLMAASESDVIDQIEPVYEVDEGDQSFLAKLARALKAK